MFHYGDTRETVEKILGKDSEAAIESMEYYRRYPDDTQVLYRETDGEEHAVIVIVSLRRFTTYQGVSVGDNWNDVKDRLGNVAEIGRGAVMLFDGNEQVDPYTKLEDRGDDWLMVSYNFSEDGTIEMITINDTLAGVTFK